MSPHREPHNDAAAEEIRDLEPRAAAESEDVTGGSLTLMGEMLSNVSKTRSEISQTFARNARA